METRTLIQQYEDLLTLRMEVLREELALIRHVSALYPRIAPTRDHATPTVPERTEQ
jgi:hypothetical protein